MLSKNEIKDIQSLGLKKERQERGVFIAEGPKVVSELVHLVPGQLVKVYAVEEWAVTSKEKLNDLHLQTVTGEDLQKLSGMKTANQVIAVIKQFESKEPVIDNELAIYLDTIQDPGNFGTIIRIADWFGVKNIVCNEGCADLYNAKVVQSTMASIARVNVWYDKDHSWLKKQEVPVWAATLGGDSIYKHSKLTKGILLIGNESKGIQSALLALATKQITIPRIGSAESLNAAVATGIILSHIVAS